MNNHYLSDTAIEQTRFGLLERLHLKNPPPLGQREKTRVNVGAHKPLAGHTE